MGCKMGCCESRDKPGAEGFYTPRRSADLRKQCLVRSWTCWQRILTFKYQWSRMPADNPQRSGIEASEQAGEQASK